MGGASQHRAPSFHLPNASPSLSLFFNLHMRGRVALSDLGCRPCELSKVLVCHTRSAHLFLLASWQKSSELVHEM